MSERSFRTPESYEAERITRDMLADFLRHRGFGDVHEERKTYGKTQSQALHATTPSGERIVMRVRLCWHRGPGESRKVTSAAQLLAKVKNNDWEGTLRDKFERERAEGATHLLIVQREGERIVHAALVPISALVPIWCSQRDISRSLIEQGRLGRRKKNHAMNGSSPTIWLRDDRAHEVVAALWNHPGVQNLTRLPINSVEIPRAGSDDTFDDLPIPDYSLIGSDGAVATLTTKSYVKRDPRVRAAVLERAKRKCERSQCGAARNYPGFLDVHHILGAEKSDRVWNCVALCPNCHREAHAAPNREEINGSLLTFAARFHAGST